MNGKKLERVPIEDVVVGDVVNINTGYRPLDDEDCEVLEIEEKENEIRFFIKSHHGNHWTTEPKEMIYGEKRYKTVMYVRR